VLATSGTYPKMRRTLCRPIERLHSNAPPGLPGSYKHQPPRLEIPNRPEQFFEAASPSDPGELEGVHSKHTLGIVEEADKDDVDEEVIDSIGSILTDHRDKLVVVANPPDDETGIVADLSRESSDWRVLEYSAFDSHNVEYQRGMLPAVHATDPTAHPRTVPEGPIGGVVDLETIKHDWGAWNNEPWPGYVGAASSAQRDDLDARWYRRRLGVIPPEGGLAFRPFTPEHVTDAFFEGGKNQLPPGAMQRDGPFDQRRPADGLGLDVARTGDSNVFVGKFGNELDVLDAWSGEPHTRGRDRITSNMPSKWTARFAVDANGEGSGLGDMLQEAIPNVVRWSSGSEALQKRKYKDKWAESLAHMGRFLKSGGWFRHPRLREELIAASREIEFNDRYLKKRDAEVIEATPKDDVKERLGRSPDHLDAALLAVWASESRRTGGRRPRGRRPRGRGRAGRAAAGNAPR
jgi:hypothetical protein